MGAVSLREDILEELGKHGVNTEQIINGGVPPRTKNTQASRTPVAQERIAVHNLDIAIWHYFLRASKDAGKMVISEEALAAPLQMAKNKFGEVVFGRNGRPKLVLNPEFDKAVKKIQAGYLRAENPKQYLADLLRASRRG